ncbi:MAG: hypothetical protein AVDCRST_MAG49-3122, partial [uncultured Thermomicrobiales bacterium]
WQHPFAASFGSRVRDEVPPVGAFDAVLEAQTVIADRRTIDDYNRRRPRSGLEWRPAAAYPARLTTDTSERPARLSPRPDRQTGVGQAAWG